LLVAFSPDLATNAVDAEGELLKSSHSTLQSEWDQVIYSELLQFTSNGIAPNTQALRCLNSTPAGNLKGRLQYRLFKA
jgi:hypothetical protein